MKHTSFKSSAVQCYILKGNLLNCVMLSLHICPGEECVCSCAPVYSSVCDGHPWTMQAFHNQRSPAADKSLSEWTIFCIAIHCSM